MYLVYSNFRYFSFASSCVRYRVILKASSGDCLWRLVSQVLGRMRAHI